MDSDSPTLEDLFSNTNNGKSLVHKYQLPALVKPTANIGISFEIPIMDCDLPILENLINYNTNTGKSSIQHWPSNWTTNKGLQFTNAGRFIFTYQY